MAVVDGAGDVGHALKSEEGSSRLQDAVGGEEESCAADDGSYNNVADVWTDALKCALDGITGEAEQGDVASVEGFGRVGTDGGQWSVIDSAIGVGNGECLVPEIGSAGEDADFDVGTSGKYSGANVGEGAATDNAYFCHGSIVLSQAYKYYPELENLRTRRRLVARR